MTASNMLVTQKKNLQTLIKSPMENNCVCFRVGDNSPACFSIERILSRAEEYDGWNGPVIFQENGSFHMFFMGQATELDFPPDGDSWTIVKDPKSGEFILDTVPLSLLDVPFFKLDSPIEFNDIICDRTSLPNAILIIISSYY